MLISQLWSDRDQGLDEIIGSIEEFYKRNDSITAFNQLFQTSCFSEKNMAVIIKFLQIFSNLIDLDRIIDDAKSSGKEPPYQPMLFVQTDKLLAFVLDKYSDSRCEKQAENTFMAFLRRNNNSEFYDIICLLISKKSYYNI